MRSALVIGHGSIGRRHAQVLQTLGFTVSVVSRRGEAAGYETFGSAEQALAARSFDYVVVATETATHLPALVALARAGYTGAVMVEKPLLETSQQMPEAAFASAGVGYNLRFHPVVMALREALQGCAVEMASFHVGQWLGDWRPDRDVAQSYSATRAGGGGVLRDLSHELDLANWLFGPWRRVAALGGKLGSVTVDADDGWGILLACPRCPVVTIQLNCLDRVARRTITVHAEGKTWHADLIAATLEHGGTTQAFSTERDDTFMAMHRALMNGGGDVCSFDEGLRVVALIDAVERASVEQVWIGSAAA